MAATTETPAAGAGAPSRLPGGEPVAAALAELRAGRMVLLRQAEDRLGADLVVAAERITPEAVNFMAKEGRGLVRIALTPDRCDELGLRMQGPHGAFTVSIEARHGVTTGISAADRARTIEVAADPASTAADLVRPGHVFPLRAAAGGTLDRVGPAEAAVDLARLAGLEPAGALCEVLDGDGMVAEPSTLAAFAGRHGLVQVHIEDVANHRRGAVEPLAATDTRDAVCGFTPHPYRSAAGAVHVALVRGDVAGLDGVPVHVHRECLAATVFASRRCGCARRLERALFSINALGAGVVVYLRTADGAVGHHRAPDPVDYATAARILEHRGVRSVRVVEDGHCAARALEAAGMPLGRAGGGRTA